jgi:hypothetical protein
LGSWMGLNKTNLYLSWRGRTSCDETNHVPRFREGCLKPIHGYTGFLQSLFFLGDLLTICLNCFLHTRSRHPKFQEGSGIRFRAISIRSLSFQSLACRRKALPLIPHIHYLTLALFPPICATLTSLPKIIARNNRNRRCHNRQCHPPRGILVGRSPRH